MKNDIISEYNENTNKSAKLFKEATNYLPGGDTRSVTYYTPHPSFVESASGCHLKTVDSHTLVDFLNNYTQSVLGHTPDEVVDTVCDRFRDGNCFAAPSNETIELANTLVERIPSVELVRFCNSGTEATMNAIRGAMAVTGNESVLKIKGGYHGTHDTVEIGVSGSGREHMGIPKSVEDRVLTVPFNDEYALKRTIETHGDDLACFILEPIMGVAGMIPATPEYLSAARDLTEDNNILLIFDEVMSFRLSEGGAQERYGVRPDLTTLGKLIGGGLPVGAFGGRAEVMEVFHPENGKVAHSGTFNGNPATMAGGTATLEAFDAASIDKLNSLGDQLRIELQSICDTVGYPLQVTGDGSLFQIHFTDDEVTNWQSSTAGSTMSELLFLGLLNQGIFIAPRGMGNLSTATGCEEVDLFLSAFDQVTKRLEGDE